MTADQAAAAVRLPTLQPGPQLQWEIEQFYYAEAKLLDERNYEKWIDLMAPEVTYEMPIVTDRLRRDGKRFSVPDEIMVFADNLVRLKMRVRRLTSGTAWSEDPRSRARHLISNIQIEPAAQSDEIEVASVFMVYVSRMNETPNVFSGQRQDLLRRVGPGRWQIVRRKIAGDQTVIPSNNLALFF